MNLFHLINNQKYLTNIVKEMETNQHFIKLYPPLPDQLSPRKPEQISRGPNLKLNTNFSQLIELKMGNYFVRAQRVTNNQNIEGYAVLYDQQYNKLLFEGQFIRSKRNGFGLQYDLSGMLIFQGYFKDDKYDGWGHSSIYTGEYREGLYDGYGVLSSSNTYYEGYFHKGFFSGEGIYFSGQQMIPFQPIKNVNIFLSQVLKNNLQILDRYRVQQIYTGQWKLGRRHGFGRMWRKDYWYAGQFSNDLPHGFGAQQDKKSNKVTQTKYKLGTKIDQN